MSTCERKHRSGELKGQPGLVLRGDAGIGERVAEFNTVGVFDNRGHMRRFSSEDNAALGPGAEQAQPP